MARNFLICCTLLLCVGVLSFCNANKKKSGFRYVPAKDNCKKGTLYYDGCTWCECMGKTEDECDKGECQLLSESDELVYEPKPRKRKSPSALEKRSPIDIWKRSPIDIWKRSPVPVQSELSHEASTMNKRSVTSTVCRANDPPEFFLDKYQCFCKDASWFWCRVEATNTQHDPFPTGHMEIDLP